MKSFLRERWSWPYYLKSVLVALVAWCIACALIILITGSVSCLAAVVLIPAICWFVTIFVASDEEKRRADHRPPVVHYSHGPLDKEKAEQ